MPTNTSVLTRTLIAGVLFRRAHGARPREGRGCDLTTDHHGLLAEGPRLVTDDAITHINMRCKSVSYDAFHPGSIHLEYFW